MPPISHPNYFLAIFNFVSTDAGNVKGFCFFFNFVFYFKGKVLEKLLGVHGSMAVDWMAYGKTLMRGNLYIFATYFQNVQNSIFFLKRYINAIIMKHKILLLFAQSTCSLPSYALPPFLDWY